MEAKSALFLKLGPGPRLTHGVLARSPGLFAEPGPGSQAYSWSLGQAPRLIHGARARPHAYRDGRGRRIIHELGPPVQETTQLYKGWIVFDARETRYLQGCVNVTHLRTVSIWIDLVRVYLRNEITMLFDTFMFPEICQIDCKVANYWLPIGSLMAPLSPYCTQKA